MAVWRDYATGNLPVHAWCCAMNTEIINESQHNSYSNIIILHKMDLQAKLSSNLGHNSNTTATIIILCSETSPELCFQSQYVFVCIKRSCNWWWNMKSRLGGLRGRILVLLFTNIQSTLCKVFSGGAMSDGEGKGSRMGDIVLFASWHHNQEEEKVWWRVPLVFVFGICVGCCY